MRAGANRLMSIIAAELGHDPTDGSLYVFVSRNASRCKMLVHGGNGWILYSMSMLGGTFKWGYASDGNLVLEIRRNQLLWLLDGLSIDQPKAVPPVTAHIVI